MYIRTDGCRLTLYAPLGQGIKNKKYIYRTWDVITRVASDGMGQDGMNWTGRMHRTGQDERDRMTGIGQTHGTRRDDRDGMTEHSHNRTG